MAMTGQDERDAKQDIGELLVRYCTGIDRRDWDLFRTCFTDDCHADYGDVGMWDGAGAITEFMAATHAPMGHTLHRLSNVAVSVHGETAEASSYVDAVLMSDDGSSGINAYGWYDDALTRTADGWRIARRRFTMVNFDTIGR